MSNEGSNHDGTLTDDALAALKKKYDEWVLKYPNDEIKFDDKPGRGNVPIDGSDQYVNLSRNFKKCFKEALLSELEDKTFILIVILVISWCKKKIEVKK